jgi:protein O-mannosyl-transferase
MQNIYESISKSLNDTINGRSKPDIYFGQIAIVVLAACVYWSVVSFPFVCYDDPAWIHNPEILRGLTLTSLRSSVIRVVNGDWCPLTNLTFVLESASLGIHSSFGHLINLALHVTNSLLLLRFLSSCIGFGWRSLIVAGFFAVHPVNVEAVTWVASRKDVLSTLFLFLTFICYVSYTRTRSGLSYCKVLFFYVLALASKPSTVTAPFCLLLLDVWPLGRLRSATISRLIWEKVPLVAFGAADAWTVFNAERSSAGIPPLSLAFNCQTAVIGYARHLANAVAPMDLNVIYHSPQIWPTSLVLLSVSLLCTISAFCCASWRFDRSFSICWLLFLVSLAPVIKLIPEGRNYMTDRYGYVPDVWIFLFVANALAGGWRSIVHGRAIICGGLALAVVLMAVDAKRQVGFWESGTTLFRRAMEIDRNDWLIQCELAVAYWSDRDYKDAVAYIDVAISRGFMDARLALTAARIFQDAGDPGKANFYYLRAWNLSSRVAKYGDPYVRFLLLRSSAHTSRVALEIAHEDFLGEPSSDTSDLFALSLAACGNFDKAIGFEQMAVALDPDTTYEYENHLGQLLRHKMPELGDKLQDTEPGK